MKNIWSKIFVSLLLVALCQNALAQSNTSDDLTQETHYKSLLKRDSELQHKEDSIRFVINDFRQELMKYPQKQTELSEQIISLEMHMMNIQKQRSRLVDSINYIEKRWVVAQYNEGDPNEDKTLESGAENEAQNRLRHQIREFGSLSRCPFVKENLAVSDFKAFTKANQMEARLTSLVQNYIDNYESLVTLSSVYDTVKLEQDALQIYDRYEALEHMNQQLADSLSRTWSFVYDNKQFAYGYLLDLMRHEDLLMEQEELVAQTSQQMAKLRGQTVSDELVDYAQRKALLLRYELRLADLLDAGLWRDSLQGALNDLQRYKFNLPKTSINERQFIVFEDISFPRTTPYSYQNPIPECRIYTKGTIYRVLLGTFNTKRAVSIFRGTTPLSYVINDDKKWAYYAGGFATRDEADQACKLLKKRGFYRPEVVVWIDGSYRNLAHTPMEEQCAYRVEISGVVELSDDVKAVIEERAAGYDLSRVGQQLYIVGLFTDKALAEGLEQALIATDSNLKIKITEIVSD